MIAFGVQTLMGRKVSWRFLLALVLLGGCLLFIANVPRVSESAFCTRIERELPLGTPRAEVEAWLESNGYGYRNRYDRSGRAAGLGGQFSNYYIDLFRPTVIHFEFVFDREDKTTYVFIQESPRLPQLDSSLTNSERPA